VRRGGANFFASSPEFMEDDRMLREARCQNLAAVEGMSGVSRTIRARAEFWEGLGGLPFLISAGIGWGMLKPFDLKTLLITEQKLRPA
jgi:hypothetical protein